ncbi:MAG: Gfo/Idh/MocA family protein [Oceanihabitans sp.]
MDRTRNENQKIRIGIIGLGSIGWTHINALHELGVTSIYALRTNKGAKVIDDLKGVKQLFNLEEFLALNLNGIIISNPTALHVETILSLNALNIPLFVEKPIASETKELEQLTHFNKNLIKVGYCLRYHPIIKKVKSLLNNNLIGNIFHSRIQVGQYLPSWHPYTDYRKEYFSRKELGGGALRTLSHELDLLVFFLNEPEKVYSLTGKISDLEIDVDDYSIIIAKYKTMVSRVELDFFSLNTYRNGSFYGDNGEIHYDAIKKTITITYRDNNKPEEIINTFKETNMYVEQMQDFLNTINGKPSQLCTYKEAVSVMNIIEESENNNYIN